MDPCTGLQRMSRCWILPAELEQLSVVEYALDFDLGMDDPTDIRCSGDCAQLVQVGCMVGLEADASSWRCLCLFFITI